jgi:hypothetical protein
MKLKVAKSITEYKQIIDELKSDNESYWFRGMSKATYSLEPSLFREKRIVGLEYSGRPINGRYYKKSDAVMKSDIHAIEEFIKHSKIYYPEKCKDFNLVDYLYIMQHYDIPTRLLDFSKNELIALYFSVSSDSKEKNSDYKNELEDFYENNGHSIKGASVHCINPGFTNENTSRFVNIKDEILNIDDIDKKSLANIVLPVCIETNNKDPRIIAQSGVFMLFGSDYKRYEEYEILEKEIVKIFIPNSCRQAIKKELKNEYKIYHATVYPDMKGISMEIIEQIENKYKSDCKTTFG